MQMKNMYELTMFYLTPLLKGIYFLLLKQCVHT